MSEPQINGELLEVAIPTYNGSATIAEAIHSIYKFLGVGIRVTVYDNASTDNAKTVVEELMGQFPNLGFAGVEKNQGFDGNVRRCIAMARASYVWIFSDDDIAPAGEANRVFDSLRRCHPSILYFNHFPFYENDTENRGELNFRFKDEIYESGTDFFYDCDLGFISSLVFKTAQAQKYVDFMGHSDGDGQAHLEASSRISLQESGPFVLMGSLPVGARALRLPRYHGVRDGFVAKALFFNRLRCDGLLAEALFRKFIKQLFGVYFIFIVIKDRAFQISSPAELRSILSRVDNLGRFAGGYYATAKACIYLPAFLASMVVKGYYLVRSAKRTIVENSSH